MEKSFGEILTDSFSVFKKSVLPVFGIWGILLGVIIFCGICAAIIRAAVAGTQALSNVQNPMFLMAYAVPVIVGVIFLSFMYYVFFAWMILVIRNNATVGKSIFKETFFEAARKLFKIILLGILIFIVYSVAGGISYLLLHKYFFILMFPLILVLVPVIFTTFYAVLCRKGGFWENISEAVSLGFARWFKIVGYTILFMICYMVIFVAITYGVSNSFRAIGIPAIGSIILFFFQIAMMIFSQCFYTVFYLDLANVKPQQEIEVRETLDDEPILEQKIEQQGGQKPTQPSDENKEPPHMEVLK